MMFSEASSIESGIYYAPDVVLQLELAGEVVREETSTRLGRESTHLS
jgi:hypothetical protein